MDVAFARSRSDVRFTQYQIGDHLYEFLSQNSLYVVLLVVLVVWIGIFGYLNRIESRIKKLEDVQSK